MSESVILTRTALEAIIARTPFAIWVDARLDRFEHGEVEVSLALRRDLTQHHGFAHGAVVGFLADSACAWAAASVAGDVVTAEYKLNLLAPAIGDRLVGLGRAVQSSARQVVCLAEVFAERSGERRIVAVALATVAALKADRR